MVFFNDQKKSKFLILIFILVLSMILFSIGCSMAGGGSTENGDSTTTTNVTMSGSFKISVNPNGNISSGLINFATIQATEYTLTSIDITVTNVSTSAVVGTFRWVPANGLTTYDVAVTGYGQYEIRVIQTGVDVNGNTGTSEDTEVVNIQPSIITVVTIVPGGTLTITVGSGSSSSEASSTSNSASSASSITMFGPFSENFDTIALGEVPAGWNPFFLASENSIVGTVNNLTTLPASSPNCLKMYDGSSTSGAGISIYLQESNYGQLRFDIKHASSADKSQAVMILKDSSSNDIVGFRMNNSNTMNVKRPDGTSYNFLNYNRDTWYTCQINWDRITGYYKILINGVDYGIFPMMNTQAINRIFFYTGSGSDSTYFNSTSYIDNVVYTTDVVTIDGSLSGTFSENFDTTAVGSLPAGFTQNVFPNVGCEVTNEITAHSSPNCLKIYDNSTSNGASLIKDLPTAETYGQFTYYFYMPSSSPWAGTSISGSTGSILKVFFQLNRTVTLYDDSGNLIANLGSYTADTWNKFTIKWDAATYKFKILLNDVDYGTFSFLSNSAPNRIGFGTQGLDAGHLNYYDDFSLTKNVETIN